MDMCKGCVKANGPSNLCCSSFKDYPGHYIRAGVCPLNLPVAVAKKGRIRVGQQKGSSWPKIGGN